MGGVTLSEAIPVSEKTLRDLSRGLSKAIPNFAGTDSTLGVKELHDLIGPILDTADLPDLSLSHRAAATNALCGVIEQCQATAIPYVNNAILGDSIWIRLLDIFLQRSDNAKGKSMRQILLVLTGLLLKNTNPRSSELRDKATVTFLDIICQRQDRVKVKPALQGLAHFIQKDLVSIEELIQLYSNILEHSSAEQTKRASAPALLHAFLAWIVHHDTALSAGHLLKNFLVQLRRSSDIASSSDNISEPVWISPVIETLHHWPERIQEFKTHVFPHCFLPDIIEYTTFLSYLHFSRHVDFKGKLPVQMRVFDDHQNSLDDFEEFRILLATIQTGKELGIVKDTDYRVCRIIQVDDAAVHLPDDIFGSWLAHPEPEVRLAGLFLSVHSTAVTRPITGGVFKSLRRNLVHLHTESDANFRRELIGYLQKLFDRLRGSTATLVKGKGKPSTTSKTRLSFSKECFGTRKSSQDVTPQDPLLEPLSFIVWYMKFLEWELRSTATYQRRITALRALTVVLRSGLDPRVPHAHLSKSAQGQLHWAHGLHIATPQTVRSLLDLVLDPFDDIRDASVSTLQICLESFSKTDKEATLMAIPRFISRAEATMLRTGRADQADGVARAYSLLFSLSGGGGENNLRNSAFGSTRLEILERLNQQLKQTLILARDNLSEAVNGRPVHGTFASLRYIIDQEGFYDNIAVLTSQEFSQWKSVHDDLLISFESLWTYIQHVLCADAPEGHIPEELEEEASLDTKEILSYSWRGLKEASILLRTAISKAPVGDDDRALIPTAYFEKLGRLCFTQLVELRHRGAFSTVAQTFAVFCRRCLSTKNDALQALPEKWYKETLSSIQDKAAAITRRSAGIPSLMAGIISADPQPGGLLFQRAMKDLIAESSLDAQSSNIEESRLPQVHALNCIKEIFTTSRLSIGSEAYIGEGLELAAKTLNSKIWPIRNCSLMLFKALIERLLGSDEAQDWKERERAKTSRFSYTNYPSLVSILSDLLDPSGPLKKSMEGTPESSSPLDLHGAEGVFPALQILRQARPPDEYLGDIISSVEKLLASPHWHLRDMAARTVVSLRSQHELCDASLASLSSLGGSKNVQHGKLMAVKYMLRKLMYDPLSLDTEKYEALLLRLHGLSDELSTKSNCPFTLAAFLDIAGLCGTTLLRREEHESTTQAWSELMKSFSIGSDQEIALSVGNGHALLHASFAQLFFIDRMILRPNGLSIIGSEGYQSIGDALILLAAEDPDTCLSVLEVLDNVIRFPPRQGPAIPLSLISAQIFQVILHTTDPEVMSKAQAILANALMNSSMREDFFNLVTQADVTETLDKLELQCLEGSPSNMQSALHLLSFFLDFAFVEYPDQRRTLLGKIARYIRLLRMTMLDTNPFDARFGAVQSVLALKSIWSASTNSNATAPLILGLGLVLYDMLNDDDDEVRDGAALATANLLRAQQNSHIKDSVPILTSHRLAIYLINTFSGSRYLLYEALRRLLGDRRLTPLLSTPFAKILAAERKEDTALFATEKQNLFKDETLDAVLWSKVLCSLRPSVVPVDTRLALTKWAIDALATLKTTVEGEVDGALGWTSKSEVFTLGIRVIYAAEIALQWGGGELEEKGQLMRALCEFREMGVRGEIHCLWLERLDVVLEQEVIKILRKVEIGLSVLK